MQELNQRKNYNDDLPKVVMTLLVRDEEDIIEDNIRFHHQSGVDHFIVMDNLSEDNTANLLYQLSKNIPISIMKQHDDNYAQSAWVTEMARKASEIAPDGWVINGDADEFWLPSGETLKSYLRSMPDDVSCINVNRYNAVLEAQLDNALSATTGPRETTVFECNSVNALGMPLPTKCIHRASPHVVVAQGNHSISGVGGRVFQAEDSFLILHFPYRSLSGYKRKIIKGGKAYLRNSKLPVEVGATWREHYKKLKNGGLDDFWKKETRTPQDVLIDISTKELFCCDSLKGILDNSKDGLKKSFERTEKDSKKIIDQHFFDLAQFIGRIPRAQRPFRPLYHNFEYSVSGPRKQLDFLRGLARKNPSVKEISDDFPMLRDAFSLFPQNDCFKDLFSDVLRHSFPLQCARFSSDCNNQTVIMHVTCRSRLDLAFASEASFGKDMRLKHIHVIGDQNSFGEKRTPLSFSYEGNILSVPCPDSYESLHRKVFYALMLLDLLSSPKIVFKIDDNLHASNVDRVISSLEGILKKNHAYAGKSVGSQLHRKQWHGWHIGKCQDQQIENRGYQFPLPKEYAAGGYGYALNPNGISACSYMYLSMMSFFDLYCVGLEDVFVGHAAHAAGIDLYDISSPETIMAFPGMVSI